MYVSTSSYFTIINSDFQYNTANETSTIEVLGSSTTINNTITGSTFNKNSAINFNSGYYKLPDNVYFNGDFTILAWVKVNEVREWSNLIDCGVQERDNNVIISLSRELNGRPEFDIFNANEYTYIAPSTTALRVGVWEHIADVQCFCLLIFVKNFFSLPSTFLVLRHPY